MAEKDVGRNAPDAGELAEGLRQTLGRFVRSVRTLAGTPTSSQSETLSLLEREGSMTVAALAERRNVKHQSMRLVAGQLETNKLIVRSPNLVDARSHLLSITPLGQDELSRARHARASKIADLIEDRLSDDEKRSLAIAIRIIDKLS
nr:MarR family transcriptional regulator [Rhizobium sp. NFR07]